MRTLVKDLTFTYLRTFNIEKSHRTVFFIMDLYKNSHFLDFKILQKSDPSL